MSAKTEILNTHPNAIARKIGRRWYVFSSPGWAYTPLASIGCGMSATAAWRAAKASEKG